MRPRVDPDRPGRRLDQYPSVGLGARDDQSSTLCRYRNAQPKYLDQTKTKKTPNTERAETTSNVEDGKKQQKSVAEMYSEAYDKADYDDQKGLVVFQRYCHLYRKGEMEAIVERVDNVTLVESGYESGNYFVILQVCR